MRRLKSFCRDRIHVLSGGGHPLSDRSDLSKLDIYRKILVEDYSDVIEIKEIILERILEIQTCMEEAQRKGHIFAFKKMNHILTEYVLELEGFNS